MSAKHLPTPYLVEISRNKTTINQVAYYEPDVIHCPSSTESVLRAMLQDRWLFSTYGKLIKNVLLRWMLDGGEISLWSKGEVVGMVIQSIIEEECRKRLGQGNGYTMTRSLSRDTSVIVQDAMKLRKNRMVQEAHLSSNFLEDCLRSIQELNFVLASQRKGVGKY